MQMRQVLSVFQKIHVLPYKDWKQATGFCSNWVVCSFRRYCIAASPAAGTIVMINSGNLAVDLIVGVDIVRA